MKKILVGLIFIAYAISSFVIIKYFEISEIEQTILSDKPSFNVSNWRKDEKPEQKLKRISQIAYENKTNIYKLSYNPTETSSQQKISIYVAVGNENDFYRNFTLESGRLFNEKDSSNKYLSSLNSKDSNQLGLVSLFNPHVVVEIKPIEAAKYDNLKGLYIIDNNKTSVVKKIEKSLEHIGFSEADSTQQALTQTIADKVFNKYFFVVMVIIFLLSFLSFLYYILLNYKELAIKKMFGYTYKDLIFRHLMIKNIKIHAIAFILNLIVLSGYLFFYNGMSKISFFIINWFKWELLFTCVSIILISLSFFMVYNIEIVKMLKNKKPLKLVQILNYSSKFLFSTCLIIVSMNLLNNYQELTKENTNKKKWESTMHYSFYEFQDSSSGDFNQWTYETGIKSKQLFALASKKGAMLIKPSDGITDKEIIENKSINDQNFENYLDPYEGNVIQVNNNYLKNNPVYNLKGEKISNIKSNENSLVVLVPEKFTDRKNEILQSYSEWYQFKRYIDEDVHNESMGKKIKKHDKTRVKLIFIKNGQKHFLYNPNFESKNQNYIKDSLIMIINSKNMGADSYLNYMSSGYFFPYVGNAKNPYDEVEQDIKSAGLENTILTSPSLYSNIDSYMFNLKNEINLNLFLASVLLIVEIIITLFMTLNYLERNKTINAVYKIHGFSFAMRHYKFILVLMSFWLAITFCISLMNLVPIITVVTITFSCFVVETIITLLVVKLNESKKTKDVLKGA
ncbi:DUF1430 domain-containing protein [Priestia megaterium]|uniref:DUF1430 domain-containing protein n=1 Tax=Priestia megaterium TaxID=1404 RepID=UPI00263B819D|nr:DUF1430 domain-containing protein [Priestia megaterium]MDN4865850.1 DUF1430 domain-containing protein [Priestia megaterium]